VVQNLGERIGQQVDRDVQISSEVDPDILGGVVLQVGNVILDASIKSRLEQLRKQVAQA
jgi:F-type H+-transporting ATPase subunit delta